MTFKDKEKENEYRRQHYLKNREQIKALNMERMRAYRAKNPEYMERSRLRLKFVRDNNPEYVEKERIYKEEYWKKKLSDPEEKKRIYEVNHQRRLARKKYCLENKICHNKAMTCNEKAIPTHKMCEMHIFEEYAHRHLNNDSRWKELRDLFYSQDKKCYLTGKELVFGINASLDHIVPTSKGGSQTDISNLAWMDMNSNYAKNNLSNSEFVELCQKVALAHQQKVLTETKNSLGDE